MIMINDEKRIKKDFYKFVSLNMLSQIAFSCYTVADTFFVADSLAADGLTALNLAFPMFCFISGIGLMIGMGGSTKYTINLSRGDKNKANRVFTNSFIIMAITSIILVLLGLFFSGQIVRLLGANDEVFSLTNTYLKVMMLFAPAFLANNLLLCFVRNDGRPDLSMKAMMTSSFSNIILDYIFIVRIGMGILGAILATGLAPVISILIMLPFIISDKRNFKFDFSKREKDLSNGTFGILSCGVPFFLTEATSGIVMFLFNYIILRIMGNLGVAAFSIVTVISLVVIALYTGLAQGIQPLFSRSYGSCSKSELSVLLRYSLTTMAILSVVIYAIIYFCADPIALVFNSESDMVLQDLAVTGLKIYFIAAPFIGFNIVIATFFTTTGRASKAQIITMARGFVVLIPVAFGLSFVFKMTGVWCAYPMSEFIVAIISLVLFITSKKKSYFHKIST